MVAYGSRYWLTYRQAEQLGGNVKKGENGTKVVFWKIDEYEKENKETAEIKKRQSILIRYYSVFNMEQCDGIKPNTKAIQVDADTIRRW
jgi:antirestriction protein ArdC